MSLGCGQRSAATSWLIAVLHHHTPSSDASNRFISFKKNNRGNPQFHTFGHLTTLNDTAEDDKSSATFLSLLGRLSESISCSPATNNRRWYDTDSEAAKFNYDTPSDCRKVGILYFNGWFLS